MTTVDLLIYLQKEWQTGWKAFPFLKGLTPAQVLSLLPEQDERYALGEEGLAQVIGEIPQRLQRERRSRAR